MHVIRTDSGGAVAFGDGTMLPIRHVIGIGRNYADHARERGAEVPDRPLCFVKNPGSVCLDGEDIVIPGACLDPETGGEQVDYEAELAVVIGAPTRDVPEARALETVLGYACANDVSARWWQRHGSGGQFTRGKSFDTFCPLGPRVVERDAIPDPQSLTIRCRVNGEVRQESSTSRMIFPVRALISELSRGTTLVAGTVILTGTPAGVGAGMNPPRYLRAGDRVEVEIEGIGVLSNGVREEAATARAAP